MGGHTIISDERCVACGYVLRGLSIAADCPECGRPIADSVPRVQKARDVRAHLVDAPEWLLHRLHNGAGGVALGLAMLVGLGVAALWRWPTIDDAPIIRLLAHVAYCVVALTASAVLWKGHWRVSSGDPPYSVGRGSISLPGVVRALAVVVALWINLVWTLGWVEEISQPHQPTWMLTLRVGSPWWVEVIGVVSLAALLVFDAVLIRRVVGRAGRRDTFGGVAIVVACVGTVLAAVFSALDLDPLILVVVGVISAVVASRALALRDVTAMVIRAREDAAAGAARANSAPLTSKEAAIVRTDPDVRDGAAR